jgi:sugar/nucleoside kinase (ribokinase family)
MKKNSVTSSNSNMTEKITDLSAHITRNETILKSKKVTAGFDGFIDTIVRIIKTKQDEKASILFGTIREFGEYIIEKQGSSFSLETKEPNNKPGGNMPLMANTLGRLGVHVNCVGALGYPHMHPVFKNLSSNCSMYSFADPGTSTAFEFNDGKIFLAQMGMLNTLGWNKIKEIIGLDTLMSLYSESDLLCVVNWSEIDASTDIWKGLLKDVFPEYAKPAEKQIAFFDLSDCSKRSNESISEALMLLEEFSRHTKVILGLNKNEARLIYKVLHQKNTDENLQELGEKIFEKLAIETLLLHSSKEAIAFNKEDVFSCKSFFISNPVISTGAGDNFNAGFCTAQLLQSDPESSLIFANAVSGFYVKTGVSPQLTDVIKFLEEHK